MYSVPPFGEPGLSGGALTGDPDRLCRPKGGPRPPRRRRRRPGDRRGGRGIPLRQSRRPQIDLVHRTVGRNTHLSHEPGVAVLFTGRRGRGIVGSLDAGSRIIRTFGMSQSLDVANRPRETITICGGVGYRCRKLVLVLMLRDLKVLSEIRAHHRSALEMA